MPLGKDLTGTNWGRLHIVRQVENIGKHRAWLAKCECGNSTVVKAGALYSGDTRSCGCLRKDTLAAMARVTSRKHGFCSGGIPRWYSIWSGMMKRCYNKQSVGYSAYGARGITVCERWHDPANFLADMGEPPEGLSIDRINGCGHYEPDNCRWATDTEQAQNKSNVRWIEYNGTRDCLSGWARRLGVHDSTLILRLRKWPLEEALTRPPRKRGVLVAAR